MDPSHWEAIEPFVTSCVYDAAPETRYTERELYAAAVPFVLWAWQTAALPLERHAIFAIVTIEHFVAVGLTHYGTKAGRNTIRSRLLRIADALLSAPAMSRTLRPLGGSDPTAPYTTAELTSLRSWSLAQRTSERRSSAQALLALGLGAGLSGREIVDVKIAHITADSDGVVVRVSSTRSRSVPVLFQWESALIDHVQRFGSEEWAFRKGHESANRNLITDFVSRSSGKVQLQARRMRSTWIVHHLDAGTAPFYLMKAAGVNALEALDRFAKFARTPDESTYRSRLRGGLSLEPDRES